MGSKWKGVYSSREPGQKISNRDWMILPSWVGKKVEIHTGKEWRSLKIENKHIGYKIGEFGITKRQPIYKKKK